MRSLRSCRSFTFGLDRSAYCTKKPTSGPPEATRSITAVAFSTTWMSRARPREVRSKATRGGQPKGQADSKQTWVLALRTLAAPSPTQSRGDLTAWLGM